MKKRTNVSETSLDLGGNTLTIDVVSGKSFTVYNCTITSGTLKTTGAGQLIFTNQSKCESRFNGVSFELNSAINLGSAVTAKDLTVNYTGKGNAGAQRLYVEGVYTPNSDVIYNFGSSCISVGEQLPHKFI